MVEARKILGNHTRSGTHPIKALPNQTHNTSEAQDKHEASTGQVQDEHEASTGQVQDEHKISIRVSKKMSCALAADSAAFLGAAQAGFVCLCWIWHPAMHVASSCHGSLLACFPFFASSVYVCLLREDLPGQSGGKKMSTR